MLSIFTAHTHLRVEVEVVAVSEGGVAGIGVVLVLKTAVLLMALVNEELIMV